MIAMPHLSTRGNGFCRICGNAEGNREFTAREMMFGLREEFGYFECAACGCVQIAELPADLSRYYPADYYAHSPPKHISARPWRQYLRRSRTLHMMGRDSVAGAIITRLRGPTNIPEWLLETRTSLEARVLDVGCGSGHFLVRMSEWGFTHLTGVDPYLPRRSVIGCVTLLRQSVASLEGAFDLIVFNHSFEHDASPRETLQHAARLLAPKGTVVIRIPVADSYAWRTYGSNWAQLDAPRHAFLHTRKSMALLAENADLQLARVIHDSFSFQFWGSEQYLRDIPLVHPQSQRSSPEQSLFSDHEMAEFARRSAELNRAGDGDQASFYLRHKSASSESDH